MVDLDFDLLGDPIPEGWGKRGRPPHVATQKNRNKVMMLLAMGWSNVRIAAALAITPPTLRKNYFRELKVREEALHRMKAAHMEMLWDQAKAGNVSAMKEIGRLIAQFEAAMFGARPAPADDDDDDLPQPKLGKKEQAAKAASTAGEDSDWGSDLRFN